METIFEKSEPAKRLSMRMWNLDITKWISKRNCILLPQQLRNNLTIEQRQNVLQKLLQNRNLELKPKTNSK